MGMVFMRWGGAGHVSAVPCLVLCIPVFFRPAHLSLFVPFPCTT